MAFQGYCWHFLEAAGLPKSSCCQPCIEEMREGDPGIQIHEEQGDLMPPNVPTNSWFKLCCTHFTVYKQWEKETLDTDENI